VAATQAAVSDLEQAYRDLDAQQRLPARHNTRRFADINQVRTVKALPKGGKLEQPTDEIISALREDDPRIDVVHAPENGSIWDALEAKLDEDFTGHHKLVFVLSRPH
jgi:hypothetical protein